jgi:ATP diphosphatase
VADAIARNDLADPREELGDLLQRFAAIEHALAQRGRAPQQASLAEMDALWDEAKVAENVKSKP